MRRTSWLASVQGLFERRKPVDEARRRLRPSRAGDMERLEERRVMAFDLVAAYAESATPFFLKDVTPGAVQLAQSPQQITLRFTPGTQIDPTTLGSIAVQRGDGSTVMPGSVLVDDAPNGNQVVIRFAETLTDGTYRVVVGGGLKSGADTVRATSIDIRLDVGAYVVSIVPQPLAGAANALTQARDTVHVFFNAEDPLRVAAAQTAAFYRLVEVLADGSDAPGVPLSPATVAYDSVSGRAVLTFAAALPDDKLFRLEIGGAAAAVAPSAVAEGIDENSSFGTAQNLGQLTTGGQAVTGAISVRPTLPTPVGRLDFPTQPGTIDEPGHRDTPADSGEHGSPPVAGVRPADGIDVRFYNFQSEYGFDPQDNQLFNAITETQKQRAREVFELFSRYAGIRFVESADQGITVVTGDMRAIDRTITTAPAGLAGAGMAIMDATEDWGESEYGGSWFRVAMHEIGHVLGLEHTYDLPSIMGGGLSGEAVFPGDYDILHLRQLYPADGSDIDLYSFTLPEDGRLTAETVIARPGQPILSRLDSVLTLYRQDPATATRELIARNDDSFGRDSFLGLELAAKNSAGNDYTYFIAVTSTGNTAFNPEVADSGSGGRTDGDYELRLGFIAKPKDIAADTVATTIVDATGRPFDGDRDGLAGGVHRFWFKTAEAAKTVYIDKTAAAAGADGSLAKPYNNLQTALTAVRNANAAAAGSKTIVRIVGSAAAPYLVGTDLAGRPLPDGTSFTVPAGVTVMIDAGAVFKLRSAIIDVGSSSPAVSRAGASLQVLGTPTSKVTFTSYHDDTIGGDSDRFVTATQGGQWGGIVFRGDSDAASKTAFVNTVSQADMRFGGGEVTVDARRERFAPIQVENTRPTLTFNTITGSSQAAIAATPNSFEESNGRVGPELRGNRLVGNSVNGLFVKIDTGMRLPIQKLDVPARFRSSDIVYVLQENLLIAGGAGGYVFDGVNASARQSGRLTIDPGVVVKLDDARIELELGTSQLIAEGQSHDRVIFTSLGDNRFGAGGTFDTNGNQPDGAAAGDWGGIVLRPGSKASIDQAYVGFGGGQASIDGIFDTFSVVEVHQGDLRLANSRIENNAAGGEAATVAIRGAQPVIVGNDFRSNRGAAVSINANSLTDSSLADPGRSSGFIDRFTAYDANRGPLVRGNRLPLAPGAGAIAGLRVRGEEITVESVWDDTDIVHVLQDEIIVQNFHTATGIRLQSTADASLVVKLAGVNAGFTAAGYGLDIDDRIGGTVQILGQPGKPVILTSLEDDSVGAGLDPMGRPVFDTNGDGASTGTAGDWRSLAFRQFSNDRNVAVYVEAESGLTGGRDRNAEPDAAQYLGVLAPNFAIGTNTWESSQEKTGDENRRLGFEVHGSIAADDSTDVDVYAFTGYAGSEVWIDVDKTAGALDAMVELVAGDGTVLARSADSQSDADLSPATRVGAQPLMKDGWRGDDYYTLNPRDPGMRVILPGTQGQMGQYFIRVRSQPKQDAATLAGFAGADDQAKYEASLQSGSFAEEGDPSAGATSGSYELRVRLRQRDEKPGSTVRHADIRFATTAIDVEGLPRNSLLVGETGEDSTPNGTFADAQILGNLLQSDRNTLSVAGTIDGEGDIDWYSFALNYEQIQSIGGVNNGLQTWATVFDIDYADGFRGDLTISVFDETGKLIFVGRDSDVEDDQPGAGQGTDFDDLSRGSIGKLDPFIGSVQLPAGMPTGGGGGEAGGPVVEPDPSRQLRYYVAISSNERLPEVLNATFGKGDANYLVRLEPINSLNRIADDRIEDGGDLFDATDALTLTTNVTPFNLGDVTLFVSGGGSLITVDALRGGIETEITTYAGSTIGDIVMRSDGLLYAYAGLPGVADTAGRLDMVDTGTGVRTTIGNDSIPNVPPPAPPQLQVAAVVEPAPGLNFRTSFQMARQNLVVGTFAADLTVTFPETIGGIQITRRGAWQITQAPGGALQINQTLNDNAPVIDLVNTTLNAATGLLTIAWTNAVINVPDTGCILSNVSYAVVPDPQTVTTDQVDAIAWQRTGPGAYANLYYSVREGGQSRLYRADPTTGSAAFVPGQFGRVNAAADAYIQDAGDSLGIVTGMAFVGGTLYGVDTTGNFFSINAGTAEATIIASFGVRFAGLTLGPQNLEAGRFANTLFAIDDGGVLQAIETDGTLLSVFDVDGDGALEDTLLTGASSPTGLAFSPLDVNLWHPTTRRRADAGHGINAAPDNTREVVEGGKSFYFGFEQYVTGNAPYAGYADVNGQYGAVAGAWQQDLSTNDAIGNNYNLPGGAYGSLITNAFDLSAYSYTDKPTLYFNYFLDTQNAASKTTLMRDSARVLISLDGGAWELLATNNSIRSVLDETDGELPNVITASSRLTTLSNQHVQELYDTAQWRQARVDIGRFAGRAGSNNVRLRFDFSTAGMFDPDARDADGNLLNDIDGLANETGDFKSKERGQQNDYEGFYIDDVIIGFAERGEMVTGVSAANSAFFDTNTPVSDTSFPQVLQGAYQLEIRRGTEYAVADGGTENTATISRTFDTNDRMIASENRLGDSNLPREQGVFVVDSNVISNSKDYGIAIDAGDRDSRSGTPHPGVAINLHSANGSRLVPGAVVVNNIVSTSGQAGILFSGDAFTGDGPLAAVPLGTIINNTIYGGGTAGGIGIQVTDNAAPTILNNIFANLATGVQVDSSSRTDGAGRPRTVVARSAYSSVTTEVTGTSQTQGLVLSGNPFVNAAGGNFYLVQGTAAIDSAMDSLQDRSEFVDVTSAIGIPPSPILAPATDVFGQLRGDDPAQGSQPGLGANSFKDRGAVERIDFSRPYAVLANPEDQSVIDLDPDYDEVILLAEQLTGVTRFEIGLFDVNGTGIDPATVTADAFTFTRDGVVMVEGQDYLFRYIEGSQRVALEAPAVFSHGAYVIRIDSRAAAGATAGRVTDRANNPLLPNRSSNVGGVDVEFTQFTILLTDAVTPGVPTGVGGTPGEDRVFLTWTAPTSTGIKPITDYVVQYSTDGGVNWTTFADDTSSVTSAVVTGLVSGVGHIFRVAARNSYGDGAFSAPSAVITPQQLPPGPPTNVTGTSGSAQIVVNWTAPTFAGTQPITDYHVEWSSNAGTSWTRFNDGEGDGTTATVTGLTNGTTYLVRVRAVNIRGASDWAQSAASVTPLTVAGAVTNLAATRGDRRVTLNWTPPADNGGSAITDYVVQYRTHLTLQPWQTFEEGISATTQATVTGLENGTAYRFRVAAVNAVGLSTNVTVLADITPATVPAAPTGLVAEPSDGRVSLGWLAPSNGGSQITDYIVQYRTNVAGSAWQTFPEGESDGTAATVTGLGNGTSYVFRVAAVNAIGQGQPSAESAVATPGPQAPAPTRLTGRAGDSSVALVWTAPRVVRGQRIIDYAIDFRVLTGDVGGPWQRANDGVSTSTQATVTGLQNGQTYEFRVAAVTAPGGIVGVFSGISARYTPQSLPPAPSSLTAKKQTSTSVALSWAPPLATARASMAVITGYVVQYREATSSRWVTREITGASTSSVISRLSSTKSYLFRVAARSSAGLGAFTNEVRV